VSTDVISSAVVSNTAGSSATANFGSVNLPAGTSEVLLEVFSLANGSRLASQKLAVSSLVSGPVALAF
jgi:hypothetical protein